MRGGGRDIILYYVSLTHLHITLHTQGVGAVRGGGREGLSEHRQAQVLQHQQPLDPPRQAQGGSRQQRRHRSAPDDQELQDGGGPRRRCFAYIHTYMCVCLCVCVSALYIYIYVYIHIYR